MLLAHNLDLTGLTEIEVDDSLFRSVPTTRRKKPPTKVIIDWSANEMSAREYSDFARGKKYGATHIYIDHEGTIWQFADLMVDCIPRSKELDQEAIWIVLQNQGMPPADSRVARGVWLYEFGRHKLPTLGVINDQLEVLEELIVLLFSSMPWMEPVVPRKDSEVVMKPLSPKVIEAWRGLLLASHVDSSTVSPGPGIIDVLDELEAEWFEEDEYDEDEDTDFEAETDEEVDASEFDRDFPDPASA